ncbi:MAG: hypothetical protein HUJ16_05280 [Kangiella sp.]|nr:hypothetical protein [Kangiella sp.]
MHNLFSEYYKDTVKNQEILVQINKNYLRRFHTDKYNIVMDYFKKRGLYDHRMINYLHDKTVFYRRFSMRHLSPKDIISRLTWEIFMDNPSNMYFITINKIGYLHDNKAASRKIADEFCVRLRQRVLGRRSKEILNGFVVEEQGKDLSFHYHIILTDPNMKLPQQLSQFVPLVESTIDSLNRNAKSSNTLTGNSTRCIENDCWDVRNVRDEFIVNYVTKTFERKPKASDFIGIISSLDGGIIQTIVFGDHYYH